MAQYKVYISSVKSEFAEVRQQILDKINERSDLYQAYGMEDYTAENIPAVMRCRQDVRECNIYVCILGFRYGSIVNDNRGLSFTHQEFEESEEMCHEKIDGFTRLIFIKNDPAGKDDNPNLTAIKYDICSVKQLLIQLFTLNEDLPRLITKALDYYVATKNKGANFDKIYLCDRVVQTFEFDRSVDMSQDAVQFFLINSHEKDMPHFFIRRKELEFAEQEYAVKKLLLNPVILDTDIDYEAVEYAIKAAIKTEWDKTNGEPKFKKASNVTIENTFRFMEETKVTILIIAWQIESVHWKSDTLKEHISSFYKKYAEVNRNLQTDKRIIFVGMLTYSGGSALSREEFENKVNNITYGKPLTKFQLVKRDDIKEWINDAGIEDNPDIRETIIEKVFTDKSRDDYYMSELEEPLKFIVRKYSS